MMANPYDCPDSPPTLGQLSTAAAGILHQIGTGMVLRIPKSGYGPELHCDYETEHALMLLEGEDNVKAVRELIQSGLIHKLTELGEPPDGDTRRLGWRELGLDGDVADWWVCTQ
jgi:hypothetical protein